MAQAHYPVFVELAVFYMNENFFARVHYRIESRHLVVINGLHYQLRLQIVSRKGSVDSLGKSLIGIYAKI